MSDNLLAVLWRRRWMVLAIVLVAALAAGLGSQWLQKRYATTADVLIQPRDAASYDAVQAAQVAARTYSEALSGNSSAALVSERLGGNPSPSTVASSVEIAPVPETQLVEIRAEASDPARAKAMADAYAAVFTESVERMLGAGADMTVSVVDAAPLNRSPTRPRTALNVLIAMLLAVPLAAGAAVLRDRRETLAWTEDELELEFALAVLARVPEYGRLGPSQPAFKEAFRMLLAKLPFPADDGGPRAIAVTSVSPGDGCTTVAWELALAAVEAGRQAVVVELDRTEDEQGAGAPGFWDHVAGTADLDEVISASTLDNLFFVPGGAVPHAPDLQALEGARGRAVVEGLRRAADVVIFDAPTAGARADAISVAQVVDATLLVVDSANSSRQQIDGVVRRLRAGGVEVLGCVVNRAAAGDFLASREARGPERTPAW